MEEHELPKYYSKLHFNSVRGEPVKMPYGNGCEYHNDCTCCPFVDCLKYRETLKNVIATELGNGLSEKEIRQKYNIKKNRFTWVMGFLEG